MNLFSQFREGEAKDTLTRYENKNIPDGLAIFLGDSKTVQTCILEGTSCVVGFRNGGVFMMTTEVGQNVFFLQAPPTPMRVTFNGQEVFDVKEPQNNLKVSKAIQNKYGISQIK